MSKKKAVICDDDRTMTQIVKHALSSQGFEVIEAVDGEVGLQKIEEHHPQLILLDINMPKKDGLAVLEVLQTIGHTGAYIIMLSNHETGDIHEKAKALGAHEFVIKPFNFLGLLKKIKDLVSQGKV